MSLKREDHIKLSMEHVRFAQEELERRRKAKVLVTAEEISAQGLEPYRTTFIVDPRIGSHNRAIRFWIRALPPGDEEGGGWKTLGHRHTVEAVIYIVRGQGHSIINGTRYDWKAGDFICVPVFAWHRHINSGVEDVVYTACTSGPLSMALGIAIYEDERYPEHWVFAQNEEARQTLIPGGSRVVLGGLEDKAPKSRSSAFYREQLHFAVREEQKREQTKVLVKNQDLVFEESPMGRIAYVIDPRLGFHVRTLSTLVAEIAPGRHSGTHRHVYEEINYVLQGKGYSIVEDRKYEWKAGDVLSIPIFAWHQHFNSGAENARFLVHTNRVAMENLGYAVTQHGESAK
jgi:gentisate 1,2-dioxygenase